MKREWQEEKSDGEEERPLWIKAIETLKIDRSNYAFLRERDFFCLSFRFVFLKRLVISTSRLADFVIAVRLCPTFTFEITPCKVSCPRNMSDMWSGVYAHP